MNEVTCPNCRHEFAATALFCPHCGRAKVRVEDGDVLLGKVLGDRFLVQEKIGQGTSGTIYRAEHVTLRRKVAIKVLHHELSRDDLAIERFRREATMVADIDNEHIVEIHDYGKTPDGRLYLAMELLDGETLDAILAREGKLDFARVTDIMIQVGEALIEAHAIGYIHRDIRPRNILLAVRRGKANFVKLLDFGLSKLVESEGQAAQTSLGMTFGDPRYMSPEAARGDAIDRRADVYQLGCVAYEMLTGAPPFAGGRVFDVLSRHVSEAPVPVSQKRTDCPRWLEVAVMRMLAKRPEERFATMSRMADALRQGQATGVVMEAETARVPEAEPPASVSRVIERLGKTAMGPHSDAPTAAEVAAAAGVTRPGVPSAAASSMEDLAKTTVRRTGTPKVGVPVVPPAVAAAPTVATPMVPQETPAATASGKAAVWSRPEDQPGATGKLPTGRSKRASDSAGISSVWYQDGEGDELDAGAAEKLERARRMKLNSGDSMIDTYGPPPRPIGKIVAIAAGAVVVVVVLLVVLIGGGSGSSSDASARGTGSAVAIDAGAQVAVNHAVVDAGVAVDAAPTKIVDAAVPVIDAAPVKKQHDQTVVTHHDPDPTTTTTTTAIPDDETKAKADFFAKAGEGQLKNGDAPAAAASFKKALELDAHSVSAMIGLAEVAMGQGLYNDAIKNLKKASKLSKNSARIWALLGECYLNNGDNKNAEAAYKKALQIDPDNARARDGYNEASSRIPPLPDDPY